MSRSEYGNRSSHLLQTGSSNLHRGRRSAAWARWQEVAMQAVAAELLQQGAAALVHAQRDLELQQQQNAAKAAALSRFEQEHLARLQRLEMKSAVDAKVKVAAAIAAAAQAQEEEFKKAVQEKEGEFQSRLQYLITLKEQDQAAALALMETNLKEDYVRAIRQAMHDKEQQYATTLEDVAERIHHAEIVIEYEKATTIAGAKTSAIERGLTSPSRVRQMHREFL